MTIASKIKASPILPVDQPITLKQLGKLYSNCYISFEFSNSTSFKPSDLVYPTDGRVKVEASENGKYWGLAETQLNGGLIVFNSPIGDYDRVSIGGIVDQLKVTPTVAITGAAYYRVIVQRS